MSPFIILLGILGLICVAFAIVGFLKGTDPIAALREIGTANLIFGFILYVRRLEDQLINADTPDLETWGAMPSAVWIIPTALGGILILIVLIKKKGRLYYSDKQE